MRQEPHPIHHNCQLSAESLQQKKARAENYIAALAFVIEEKADEAKHVYSTNIQEEAYYKCSVCSHENLARKSVATNQSPAWGWTYEIPYDFEVTDVVNDRQFVAATDKQAYTICLPYDLTLPASVEIYTLSASKDDQVGFAKLATNEIKALTPYLIIPTMSGQLLNLSGGNIKKTNATLVAANDATSVAVSGQQRGGIYIINGKKVLVK